MLRALLVLMLGVVLALVLRGLAAVARRGTPRAAPAPRDALPAVRCARCGVFVPQPDALVANDQQYCSARCAAPGGDGR